MCVCVCVCVNVYKYVCVCLLSVYYSIGKKKFTTPVENLKVDKAESPFTQRDENTLALCAVSLP